VLVTTGRGRQAATQHAQRFGVILPNETLEVDLLDGLAITRWSWNPDAHSISH
jgi:hypothetical protein